MTPLPLIHGFKWTHKEEDYGTHQPVLYEAMARTTGNIVELGCGNNSTNLVHLFASDNRTVYSIEAETKWYSNFRGLESKNHKLFKIADWKETVAKVKSFKNLSVIFVDQLDWFSRRKCIQLLNKDTELMVMHDPERLLKYKLIDHFDEFFKYTHWYYPLQKSANCCIGTEAGQTLIGSNTIDVTDWEINYELYV